MGKTIFTVGLLLLAFAGGGKANAAALPDCGNVPYDYAKFSKKTANGNEGYASYAAKAQRQKCQKEWTVLVYMQASDDLRPFAFWDLYEMEASDAGISAIGSSSKNDFIVQLDTDDTPYIRRLQIFSAPEKYDTSLRQDHFNSMKESDVESPIVSLLPESNASETQKFTDFLEWGVKAYPAKHYMVIVWGHGQGWTSSSTTSSATFASRKFGGLAFDSDHGTYLDIPSLKTVLLQVSQKELGRPFDIYASDACLMQMVEVATEVSTAAQYVVGSAQVENFLGLPYRNIMHYLNADKSEHSPASLAALIPGLFKKSFEPGSLHGTIAPEAIKTVTMSSISSQALQNALLPSLEEWSLAIVAYLKESPLRGIDLQGLIEAAPSFAGGAQDLGFFGSTVEQSIQAAVKNDNTITPATANLLNSTDAMEKALSSTVVAYALGTNYDAQANALSQMGTRAFSVWLPDSLEDYDNRIGDFRVSDFYQKVPHWESWFKLVYEPYSD